METKNKETFAWTGEHQKSFDFLISYLTSVPVLSYPYFSPLFKLETDASLQGFDTVLSQREENGTSHVKVYASWSLPPSEQ